MACLPVPTVSEGLKRYFLWLNRIKIAFIKHLHPCHPKN